MAPVSPVKSASAVRFEATLYTIDGSTIARLPDKASKQLPSRGQVAVQATVNGHAFQTVVEPDGEFGLWMRIDAKQQRAAAIRASTSPRAPTPTFRRAASWSFLVSGLAYAMSELFGPVPVASRG